MVSTYMYMYLVLLAGLGSLTWACPLADNPPEITQYPIKYADPMKIAQSGLKLTCKAAYPIEWEFDGSLSDPKVNRIRRFSTDNSSCDDYESVLELEMSENEHESFSGNLTCFSISDPAGKRTSFYLFYIGYDHEIFSNSIPRNVSLARKTPQGQFVVPCPANYEQANATLIKILDDPNGNDTEITIHLGKNLTYDPKVGFLLKADAFPDPVGKYKCLGTYGAKNYDDYVGEVEIEILASDATVSFSPEGTYPEFRNGSLRLTCESNSEIYLDTKLLPTEFRTSVSDTPIEGQRSRFKFVSSITINSTVGQNMTGEVSCHRKDSTNFRITSWKIDETKRCRCVWDNWGQDKKSLDDPYGFFLCSSGHGVSDSFRTCANPSECRLRMCTYTYNCLVDNYYTYFVHYGPFSSKLSAGILYCEVGLLSNPKKLTPKERKEFKRYSSLFSFQNLITIRRSGRRDIEIISRVGDVQNFICTIHSSILVQEIRWGMKFKNGSFTFLENEPVEVDHGRFRLDSVKITKSIKISDLNIKYVYCFASAWETGEIKNASVPIFVQGMTNWENFDLLTYSGLLFPAQLHSVEDPNKNRCLKISDTPVIFMKVTKLPSYMEIDKIVQWYNVTGMDVVTPVIPVGSIQTELVCISKSLAKWNSHFDVYGDRLQEGTNVIKIKNSHNYCFINSIKLPEYSLHSGNYTCREDWHTQNGTRAASVYIFTKNFYSDLLDPGTHSDLFVNKSQEWTLIPCQGNNPAAEVDLIKSDQEGRFVTLSYPSNSNVRPYDPKQGFFLKTNLLLKDYKPSDVYICTSVFNGVDDTESTHVRSFGIADVSSMTSREIKVDDDTKAYIVTNKEYGPDGEHGYTLAAVFTPWLFAIVATVVIVGLCIYARNLRWKLTKATCDGNGPIIYQVGEEPIDSLITQSNSQNVKSDSRIANSSYVKFG